MYDERGSGGGPDRYERHGRHDSRDEYERDYERPYERARPYRLIIRHEPLVHVWRARQSLSSARSRQLPEQRFAAASAKQHESVAAAANELEATQLVRRQRLRRRGGDAPLHEVVHFHLSKTRKGAIRTEMKRV